MITAIVYFIILALSMAGAILELSLVIYLVRLVRRVLKNQEPAQTTVSTAAPQAS